MPRVRFSVVIKENNKSFTIVKASTKVRLWKTNSAIREFQWTSPKEQEDRLWIFEGGMDQLDRRLMESVHAKTKFEYNVFTPPEVSHVYDVSYSHKDRMKKYGFLKNEKKGSSEDGEEKPRWYYLIPGKVEEKDIEAILKDSAAFNKRYRPY